MRYLKLSIVSILMANIALADSGGNGAYSEAAQIALEQQRQALATLNQNAQMSTYTAATLAAFGVLVTAWPPSQSVVGYAAAAVDQGMGIVRTTNASSTQAQLEKKTQSWVEKNFVEGGLKTVSSGLEATRYAPAAADLTKMIGSEGGWDDLKKAAIGGDASSGKDSSGMFYYTAKQMFLRAGANGVTAGFEHYEHEISKTHVVDNSNNSDDFKGGDGNKTETKITKTEENINTNSNSGDAQAGAAVAPTSVGTCAVLKSGSAIVDCMASQNATMGNMLRDKKMLDAFKKRTGKDLGEFIDATAKAVSQNPASLGAIAGAGTGNSDFGNQLAKAIDSAMANAKNDIDSESQQKIASSNPSGTYKGAANNGGAKKGAENPLAGLGGLFDSLLGDAAKKDGSESKNGHKIGLLDGRKNKLSGFGEDAWKNRDVSIFERVAVTYQDQIGKNNWSLNDWGLASNALNHKDLKRAPASVPQSQ